MKKFDDTFIKERDEGFSGHEIGFSRQEIIDDTAITDFRTKIQNLKGQKKAATDSFVKTKIQEEIDKIQKYLDEAKKFNEKQIFRLQKNENCRTRVQKVIKKALDIIEREIPYMKDYLNHETIKTGSKCSYKQDGLKPAKWVLDRPK